MSNLPVVNCDGCGVCCLHMGFPAFNLTTSQLSDSDPESLGGLSVSAKADLTRWLAMPSELQVDILDRMKAYRAPSDGALDGACSWLDPTTRLCRHHQHRPQVCRDFSVGSAGCLEWRAACPDHVDGRSA